jgi:hypothetical protein
MISALHGKRLALWLCLALATVILALGSGSVARADLSIEAATETINVDGDNSDWAAIAGLDLTLVQFEIPAGSDWEFDPVAPRAATVKVASDDTNIYVLLEVDDTFDYVVDDHGLSAALAVQFLIEQDGGPHMGAGQDDMETGLGMVDIWHWELDCGPGEMSGGGDPGDGDDPDCNLDDEYATDPEERDDDDSAQAENSLAGSWSHTAGTVGGAGTWIFEMSRPLSTGDPHDAQFTSGGSTLMAIAYWDPKESVSGWSDAGHLTSADDGWIEVSLPAAAAETPTSTPAATPATTPVTTPAATSTPATTPATTPVTTPTATATITVTALPTATPAGAPDTGGPPGNDDNSLVYVLLLLGALAVGLAVVVIYVALPRRGP